MCARSCLTPSEGTYNNTYSETCRGRRVSCGPRGGPSPGRRLARCDGPGRRGRGCPDPPNKDTDPSPHPCIHTETHRDAQRPTA